MHSAACLLQPKRHLSQSLSPPYSRLAHPQRPNRNLPLQRLSAPHRRPHRMQRDSRLLGALSTQKKPESALKLFLVWKTMNSRPFARRVGTDLGGYADEIKRALADEWNRRFPAK